MGGGGDHKCHGALREESEEGWAGGLWMEWGVEGRINVGKIRGVCIFREMIEQYRVKVNARSVKHASYD